MITLACGRKMFGPNMVARFKAVILFGIEWSCTSLRNLLRRTHHVKWVRLRHQWKAHTRYFMTLMLAFGRCNNAVCILFTATSIPMVSSVSEVYCNNTYNWNNAHFLLLIGSNCSSQMVLMVQEALLGITLKEKPQCVHPQCMQIPVDNLCTYTSLY